MFRTMRRAAQALSREDAEAILHRNTSGTLALLGDDDYPYAVPMSYLYADGKLYFHCAVTGHKIDAVTRHEKASFCVIDRDLVIPEKFTTHYRSVIAFGKIRLVEDREEMRRIITRLALRYSPGREAGIREEVRDSIGHMAILEMTVEHMTAKAARGS